MLKHKLPAQSKKWDYLLNMFGSTMNAGVTVLWMVMVSHAIGTAEAGIFSLAYSTSQMMYTIASFETRNFQVTDIKKEYAFSDFLTYRIITTCVMLIVSAVFILHHGFTGHKALIMFLLCLYMAVFAISDVLQANFHKNGFLSLAGLSLAGEVIAATVVFGVLLVALRSLTAAVIGMVAATTLWIFLYDLPFEANFEKPVFSFVFSKQKMLFLNALPLFLSSFLHQYIFNMPKYAIDTYLSDVEQSYYGFMVMPAFVINLVSLFAFRPQLLTLSERWKEKNVKGFLKLAGYLYLWIGAVTAVTLIGGWLLGIPILNWLYHTDLTGQKGVLLTLLLAGGFSACCTFAMALYTTMRRQLFCLVSYAVTMVIAAVFSPILVRRFGLFGAAAAYLLEMTVLFVSLLVIMFVLIAKEKEK